MNTVNPQVATWMAEIAHALEAIGGCNPGWGEFYVSEVVISYDGEESSYRIKPDEGEGITFDLVFGA